MIDEKKLIEEIVKRIGVFSEMQIDYLDFLIEKQPKVDKWIPCSERLPKQGERIIGTFDNGNGKTIVSEEQFFMPLIEKPYPMIAWMPLPQPYKGE